MQEKVTFTQKWIENSVKKFLGKENDILTKEDLSKIKYLRVGENFCNEFIIELSTACPPDPFAATDGGDEWGYACILNKDIERFLNLQDEDSDIQLSLFGFDYNYLDEEEFFSEDTYEKWDKFEKTIFWDTYYEEKENDDEFDKWYDQIAENIYSDIKQFCNVEVLRIYGTHFPDFQCFRELKSLRVLELVETCFASDEGIDELKRLKQLCCWLD